MKKAITLAVFLACCAFAQQTIPVIQQQSGGAPPAGNCQYPAQVGNMWNTIGAGTSYICTQTGTTGPNGTFVWLSLPGTVVTSCGTSASCASPTNISTTSKIVTGTTAFSASTTLAITGMPAFTSITSYSCYASDPTHAYTWTIANQSATAFTITAGTSNSDSWQWTCVGY